MYFKNPPSSSFIIIVEVPISFKQDIKHTRVDREIIREREEFSSPHPLLRRRGTTTGQPSAAAIAATYEGHPHFPSSIFYRLK
ncbi:hypothetical protein L1987_43403 [Smallanthus sonchifolius]|uniref:Uncharacterized protein n=1 Tax=Smallanthus sonchifolius TaxID=185202 RepID=A0ACB9GLG0_9ASTR|nr:hypothetical protein L1987_43403 [Smallanthus sonchifolius]